MLSLNASASLYIIVRWESNSNFPQRIILWLLLGYLYLVDATFFSEKNSEWETVGMSHWTSLSLSHLGFTAVHYPHCESTALYKYIITSFPSRVYDDASLTTWFVILDFFCCRIKKSFYNIILWNLNVWEQSVLCHNCCFLIVFLFRVFVFHYAIYE